MSSCHSLIRFLSLLCNCKFRRLDSISLDYCCILCFCYSCPAEHFSRTPRKTPSSIVQNACLLIRYLEMDVLLFRAFTSAGICLPTRCLAMGVHVAISFSSSAPPRSYLHLQHFLTFSLVLFFFFLFNLPLLLLQYLNLILCS
jgi:hypothetical protein